MATITKVIEEELDEDRVWFGVYLIGDARVLALFVSRHSAEGFQQWLQDNGSHGSVIHEVRFL